MATPRLFSLSRSLLSTTTATATATATAKQTLTSFLLHRSLSTTTTTINTSPALFRRLRPLSAVAFLRISPAPPAASLRPFSTRQAQSSLNDSNANWSSRPPKETILLDGCDFEHWLVVTDPPPEGATRDEIIESFIKTLAQVVGSEEEARMKIYSISTRCYYAFGALVSEELSYKIKELPNVRWVLPDSYLDVKNKDYGGEPFINGQAVPYDPKYHEEWIRNNQKAQERNRRNDRPRNADRSRNFERRQGPPGGNMGGPGGSPGGPPPNMGGPPGRYPGGPPPNMVGPGGNAPNMGGMPNQHRGPPPNMPPPNMPPPNNGGYGQQGNPGYGQNMPPQNNPGGYANAPTQGRMPPPNYGGQGNPGYQNNAPNYQSGGGVTSYQNTQMPPNQQQNYGPQGGGNMGGQPGGGYQGGQDVPGRDMPHYQ